MVVYAVHLIPNRNNNNKKNNDTQRNDDYVNPSFRKRDVSSNETFPFIQQTILQLSQPLNECEAEIDLVLIQTSLFFLWKLCLKNASQHKNMTDITKQEGLYQNKVSSCLVSTCNCNYSLGKLSHEQRKGRGWGGGGVEGGRFPKTNNNERSFYSQVKLLSVEASRNRYPPSCLLCMSPNKVLVSSSFSHTCRE